MVDEREMMRRLVALALAEDGVDADVTTNALATFDRPARAEASAKAAGVISGCGPFVETFRQVDPGVRVEIVCGDGGEVEPGDVVARLSGSESSILKGERTALNFLQRLSGVATLTRRYVEALKPFKTVLLDTRKTTPGMRGLEKKAVRDGGGTNHRLNLADMAMVKDNHIAMAGSIAAAVAEVRRFSPAVRIEVEVKNLDELEQALACGIDWIMLDNFPPDLARRAVAAVSGRSKLEISGNVTLETIAERAALGVDFISVGALTHSFRSLDLSLNIIGEP
jgi:nicotinate-nucleotide pyrophosphorylase (carboxylating)